MSNEIRPELAGAHRMNEISQSREGAEALQRARTGQPLSPVQQRLVDDYRAAEREHNATARPVYTGGTMKIARPHIVPRELYAIERIQDKRERTFALRELQAKMRDDKASAYNNANDPNHKNAVDTMRRTYEELERLGPLEGEE